jgi:hypothetical protein
MFEVVVLFNPMPRAISWTASVADVSRSFNERYLDEKTNRPRPLRGGSTGSTRHTLRHADGSIVFKHKIKEAVSESKPQQRAGPYPHGSSRAC